MHPCQFYRDDAALAATAATFLAPAFSEGRAMIVIGTPQHVEAIERRLTSDGYDVASAKARGQLRTFDAQWAMNALLVGDMPSRERFQKVIGSEVERAVKEFGAVRAFGEIVSLLWRDGKRAAALRLEELWGEAIDAHPLSLFCGYNLRSFTSAHDARGVTSIIATHSTVLARAS